MTPTPATTIDAAAHPDAPAWTCPCCALLCADFASPDQAAARCSRARDRLAGLASVSDAPTTATARIEDREAPITQAITHAAQWLATWRQPLFAGLGTDVAGARALYRLAARTGAILDHADGDALFHGLRAIQDRGQYIATLGEVASRAHTIVFVGTDGVARHPRLFERFGLNHAATPCRKLVFLGSVPPASLITRASVQHLPGSGDLPADVQQLAAWVSRKPASRPAVADAALATLADELLASPYAVLVWEGGALPRHGAMIVERLNGIVGMLNQTTRAATFGLGGSDGAASVNQTVTWLSGLPLRTRVSAQGLEHDPHRFATARLLADGAVDGVLWVHGFDATRVPPHTDLPRIVLGPQAMAATLDARDVFIPIATPGLHAGAHLFRTDGPVMLHLEAAEARYMTVAQVATDLLRALDSTT